MSKPKMSVEDVLEKLQLYAKDHPMDMTTSDINDRKQALALLYKLLVSEATIDYSQANKAGNHIKWSKAIPLEAINKLFGKE